MLQSAINMFPKKIRNLILGMPQNSNHGNPSISILSRLLLLNSWYQYHCLHMAWEKHLDVWILDTFPSVCGNCSKPKSGVFTGARRLRKFIQRLFLPIILRAGGRPSSQPALLQFGAASLRSQPYLSSTWSVSDQVAFLIASRVVTFPTKLVLTYLQCPVFQSPWMSDQHSFSGSAHPSLKDSYAWHLIPTLVPYLTRRNLWYNARMYF